MLQFRVLILLLILGSVGCVQSDRSRSDSDPNLVQLQTRVASLERQLEVTEAQLRELSARVHQQPEAAGPNGGSAVVLPVVAATRGEEPGEDAKPASQSADVYVTASGSKYHRETCRYAQGASAIPMSAAVPKYAPCKVCAPPEPAVSSTATPSAAASRATAPTSLPASSGQCASKTQKGARCKRSAKAGSSYCWQHGG